MNYFKSVFVGDEVTAEVEIMEINGKKFVLKGTCTSHGKVKMI